MTISVRQRLQLMKERLEAIEHQPAAAMIIQAEDARALLDALAWESSMKKELISLQEQWVRERMIYVDALASIAAEHKPDGKKCKSLAQEALESAEDALADFQDKKSVVVID